MRKLKIAHPSLALVSVWLAFMLLMLLLVSLAHAQNSLGLGTPEQAIKPEGFFAPLLYWIQQQQKEFYQLMTDTLKLIRSGEGGAWLLAGLSFSYGILHAAGPGHGKAVISSYMLANEVQLRRGIMLSFASAGLQAVVAIAGIGSLIFFLREMGLKQSAFTHWLEVASYAGVTLLGLWLLWRKTFASRSVAVQHFHGNNGNNGNNGNHDHHDHHDHHGHAHDHAHHHHHEHHHEQGEVCADCGHSHAPDPRLLDGKLGLREAWSAVLAVGLRPCTGALIVLTFAFLNGLYLAGIASVFAMALGTGITVAIIASLAVGAKNVALRLSGSGVMSGRVSRAIEIAGAGLVFLLGSTLLAASLI